MAAVGEIALGAFLQVVFDKSASHAMLYFFRRESIRTQDITYDLDDLLDEFSTEALRYELIEKSQSSTSKIRALVPTFMRPNPGDAIFDSKKSKVNEITTKLQVMSKQISTLGLHVDNISRMPVQDRERQPTTSATYERHIYGRDKSQREIINLLLMEESDLGIIPITGMGGIGKTTLAQVCFAYCAILPKDYEFEEEELVLLWMAEGFICQQGGKKMEDLGGGKLEITGLQNVVDPQDARKVNLNGKESLDVLSMVWSEGSEDLRNEGVETDVLHVLRPHSNLKELHISFYHGSKFPTWIGDQHFFNMVKQKFEPSPVLLSLASNNVPNFLGTLPNDLPCLRNLRIENCPKLLLDVPNLVLPSITTISMEAVTCPSLPLLLEKRNKLELSSLKYFYIRGVSISDSLRDQSVADEVEFANVAYYHMGSLTSVSFPNIQNLSFLPKCFYEGLRGVESLEIIHCNELMTLWQNVVTLDHCLPALRSLLIKRCPQFVSLFEEEEERQQQQQMEGPSFMMRLESLKLQDCEKLEKLPRWLHTLPFLGELQINSCPSLVSFPEKGFPSTLRKLEISGCGALESLPEWMTHTNYNLEVLKVVDCPVLKYIISPRGGLPPSLKHLAISSCAMLESLAAEEGVKINCPSLESFEIRFCNNLKFLPDASHNLKNLWRFEIALLNSLESIPEGWFSLPTNLREILISDIENLDALPHNLQNNSNFPSLEVLNVTSLRPSILKKISFDRFSSLKELITDSLMEGMSLPTSLTELTLWRARYLETLCSREFQKLTSLQVLRISECPRLASVPSLPPSLQQLEIEFCAEFTSIPEQGLPKSLLKLTILYCPKFGSFPEQGLPQSLLQLSISFCPEFGSFPDQGLPQSLLELYVRECPKLKRLCEKDKGKYWPLIRHIPKVTIDKRSIFDTGEEE
ncbi:NB-ARC domain-containing disease resistance protein [Actinidia rufa]|uniref:NB-ARC domain-containing disease resistance protein n=1 Tax=Actinidia rufa TaxID=165716 RepID=A0A7J0FNY4_9ERIC|nr:NB-ARC domain-containing disease resistance protein [Actinidia rufa]